MPETEMIIIAGSLFVDPDERTAYLGAVAEITRQARQAAGCLDFVQSPDPLDPRRIVIFERWESVAALEAYRAAGEDDAPLSTPDITAADVRRYAIGEISAP